MKFWTQDLDKARDMTQWLMKNIGPKVTSTGTVVRGEGWTMWVTLGVIGDSKPNVYVELDAQHIDEHTVMMFMLKWG
jgi:hypothetical protein